MYHSILALALTILALTTIAKGQSVDLFGLQVGLWPQMQARLLVTGADGRPRQPLASDVTLWEDGVPVPVFMLSCEPSPWKQPASVVLSIDVSNSMSRDIPPQAIAVARRFADRFVNSLTLPPSNVALQVCDEYPRLFVDFTSNAKRLSTMIAQVVPRGGNDFVAHLFDSDNGVIPLASKGNNQRSIVLITDAFWEALSNEDVQRAIDECLANRIRLFVVITTERDRSSTGIVGSLRSIANGSGGGVFEGIITDSIADALAATIATGVDP